MTPSSTLKRELAIPDLFLGVPLSLTLARARCTRYIRLSFSTLHLITRASPFRRLLVAPTTLGSQLDHPSFRSGLNSVTKSRALSQYRSYSNCGNDVQHFHTSLPWKELTLSSSWYTWLRKASSSLVSLSSSKSMSLLTGFRYNLCYLKGMASLISLMHKLRLRSTFNMVRSEVCLIPDNMCRTFSLISITCMWNTSC
jgi:hypothetical protein